MARSPRLALQKKVMIATSVISVLVACQPLPHPLADSVAPPPALALKGMTGVVVDTVSGIPETAGEALAAAMADALQRADVIANTKSRNRGSYELSGIARAGDGVVSVEWQLLDAQHRKVTSASSMASMSAGALTAENSAALKALVDAAVPSLAQALQDETQEPEIATNDSDFPQVAVRPVTGAPGDGGTSLTRAMIEALSHAEASLASELDKKSLAALREYRVIGTVAVATPDAGTQKVKITWAVVRPDGKQLGIVNQENTVPAGLLDGPWGDIAAQVAEAAAPGIVALLQRAGTPSTGG